MAADARGKRLRTAGSNCDACAAPAPSEGRKALSVNPDAKEQNLARLRRIEGQVRGIQRMVEEDRYCADILGQLSAVHEALRSVGRELMRNHLRHCVPEALRAGGERSEAVLDELVELMYRNAR